MGHVRLEKTMHKAHAALTTWGRAVATFLIDEESKHFLMENNITSNKT
jgi:hypothetical protein